LRSTGRGIGIPGPLTVPSAPLRRPRHREGIGPADRHSAISHARQRERRHESAGPKNQVPGPTKPEHFWHLQPYATPGPSKLDSKRPCDLQRHLLCIHLMGDRTGFCEATPEEDCNEAGESESAIPKWQWRALRMALDSAATVAHTIAAALGGGRGAARAGITTAAGMRGADVSTGAPHPWFFAFVKHRCQSLSCTVQKKIFTFEKSQLFLSQIRLSPPYIDKGGVLEVSF
jgi:hypothetical protein